MTAPQNTQAAIGGICIVYGKHYIRQTVEVCAVVRPIGRVLVPTKSRAAERRFQVELCRPEGDARTTHKIEHGIDEARIINECIEPRIKILHWLDHANQLSGLRMLNMLKLDRGVSMTNKQIAIEPIVTTGRTESCSRCAATLSRRTQLGQFSLTEVWRSHEKTVVAIGPGLGAREPLRAQASKRSL